MNKIIFPIEVITNKKKYFMRFMNNKREEFHNA